METHGGVFPNVSTVLKETGGGWSVVKDILNDVENRFTHSTSRQTSLDKSSAGRSTSGGTRVENFGVGPGSTQVFGQDGLNATSLGTSSDDTEDSDEEVDAEEFDDEDVGSEEMIEELGGIPEAERKSVTFTNGQMIGSSYGEIETHSGLWQRLRKIGSQLTQQQSSQETSSVALNSSSNADQLRQDADGNTMQENGETTGSVALSFNDVTDLDIKKSFQDQQLEERHGLFIRYLSPQATPNDLKEAFNDCGEIVRAQAIKPRTQQKYTYGFVDFKVSGICFTC